MLRKRVRKPARIADAGRLPHFVEHAFKYTFRSQVTLLGSRTNAERPPVSCSVSGLRRRSPLRSAPKAGRS
jgi:hypothetical protein